jgi:hypothetical protein
MLTTPTLMPSINGPAPSPVQSGPTYVCPNCGRPVLGLVPWPVNPANPCKLDEWAAHIWYLRRRCGCRTGGRVARLGDRITPLEFTYDASLSYEQRVQANLTALRSALALLATGEPGGEQGHHLDGKNTGGSNGHRT